jgi:predicted TIM-barrel fold metal-dependent hydrolase
VTDTSEVAGATDCDVHPVFKRGMADLEPYVESAAWRKRLGFKSSGWGGVELPGTQSPLTQTSYIHPGEPYRVDAAPPNGDPPASDPEFTTRDLLDRYDLGAAVLVGGNILGLGGMPNADMAAELAAAHNLWLEDVWLNADPRYRGSITVAPQDPLRAAKEVELWAEHPQMVEVFIPDCAGKLLGKREMYPIYEVAEHHGLVIAVHPGGASAGINWGAGMFAGGLPSTFFEYHVAMTQLPQSHVISLIAEGVFELFPKLKVSIVEGGFAWVPHVMWGMDKDWKSFREEVPWIKRLPSEYVREHIRVTTQPLIEPDDPSQLEELFRMMHADEILMFSTDYPHYDGDVPTRVSRRLPDWLRNRALYETPRETFRETADLALSPA